MKKYFSKYACMLLAMVMLIPFSSLSFADESDNNVTKNEVKGYIPTSDSTVGDLYRYFDSNGFESLSNNEKEMYDSMLLDRNNKSNFKSEENDMAISEYGDDLIFDTDTETAIRKHEDQVSTSGYLYSDSEKIETSSRNIDMKGLLNLVMGVSSTKNSISYTTALTSTKTCPKLVLTMYLYDKAVGEYVGFNSENEKDSKMCSIDDEFKDLKRNNTYTVTAIGAVIPPEGYFVIGDLTKEIDKSTKK